MRGLEGELRRAEPADSPAAVRRGWPEGGDRRGESFGLSQGVLADESVGRGGQRTGKVQVDGSRDRGEARRLHTGREGWKIRLVSAKKGTCMWCEVM